FAESLVIAFHWVGLDELCAVGLDAEFALLARIAGHNNLDRQTHHGAQHGICNPGVARTRVQYDLPFPDLSPDQRFQKHSPYRTVLETAARIREFRLCVDLYSGKLVFEA